MKLALACLVLLLAGCTQSATTPPTQAVTPEALALPPLPSVDVQSFLADYRAFVTAHADRANNGPEHESARAAFTQTFTDLGLTVWRHDYTDGIPQSNIVGIKWGAIRDQWILVGGHYDTFSDDCLVLENAGGPCPGRGVTQGAYDDGSGTALTLYMAKLFAPLNTTYTVAFAEFDGEERGLQGSAAMDAAFIEQTTPFGKVKVRAVIDVDMFGLNWPGVQTPVTFSHTSKAMETTVDATRRALGVPDDMIVYAHAGSGGGSDFASFADHVPTGFFSSDMGREGIPGSGAVPARVPDAPGVYPFWHLVDTWETMTAMAGGDAPLAAGFEVGAKLEASLLYAVAVQGIELDHDV